MRLDRFISQTTDYSRKQVKLLVKNGVVRVNQQVVKSPDIKVNETDTVICEGQELSAPANRYYMLHKPEGFICATKDRDHLTVLEFIEEPRKESLSIVGRLDIDTTGLVLLTDNGQWLHQVISPKHKCEKVYLVETLRPVTEKEITKLEQGVWLTSEQKRTAPAKVKVIDEYHYQLTITEGRYHQVKRMFAAVENKVESLHREQIGGIILDEDLQPGEYRQLTEEEVNSV